jgi:hypothetical protein
VPDVPYLGNARLDFGYAGESVSFIRHPAGSGVVITCVTSSSTTRFIGAGRQGFTILFLLHTALVGAEAAQAKLGGSRSRIGAAAEMGVLPARRLLKVSRSLKV